MAKKGFGSRFSILDGSTQTDIGELLSISGPSYSKETIDTTHMGSTDEFRTFLGGLRDAGEVTFEVQLDLLAADSQNHHLLLDSLEDDDTPVAMQCDLGSVVTFSFNGIVTAFEPDAPMDGKQTASITVKISGKPTLADAS